VTEGPQPRSDPAGGPGGSVHRPHTGREGFGRRDPSDCSRGLEAEQDRLREL
jgi:hypothetical protein